MSKIICAALAALCCCFALSAQTTAAYRRYATQEYMRQVAKQDPDFIKNQAAVEQHTAKFQRTGRPDTISIALVFHIFTGGKKRAIRPQDVVRQLNQVSFDFWAAGGHPYAKDTDYKKIDLDASKFFRHPADRLKGFARQASQPLIQFCLPEQDDTGKKTPGIVYVNANKDVWGMSDSLKRSDRGGSSPWDTKRYCNVWVAPLAGGVAGYAQMPGGPAATDGIVLNANYFAEEKVIRKEEDPYALGRTLVHLMGSYLNLYELWNEAQPCADDYVWDTPIHNAPNHTLDTYQHVSTCEGNPVEMTMNLMDNTRDTAQYMFTAGQVMRMQATLAKGGPRYDLRNTPVQCPFKKGKVVDEVAERITETAGPERDSTARSNTLQLQVQPNPTEGLFTVTIGGIPHPESPCRVQVFNENGAVVWNALAPATGGTESLVSLDGRNWSAGLYLIQVRNDEAYKTAKVVIER